MKVVYAATRQSKGVFFSIVWFIRSTIRVFSRKSKSPAESAADRQPSIYDGHCLVFFEILFLP